MSLRWRIALSMAAIAALVSAFGATAAYLNTADRLTASIDESLRAKAADLSFTPGGGPHHDDQGRGDQSADCPPAGLLEPATAAQTVTRDGHVVQCFEGGVRIPVDHTIVATTLRVGAPQLSSAHVKGARYRIVTMPRSRDTVLQLGRSLNENDGVLNSLGIRLFLFALGGVLAAALLGWILAIRIVSPIERLRRSAEHIARTGDLDGEVPTAGTGEVGSLTTSFATMVEALGESRRRQQQLVADASHELRTPLTSLQTNAELLERGDRLTVDQRHQVSEGIRFEVGELTDLVSELVDLARDPASDAEPVAPVALDTLATDVVEAARRRTDRAITIDVIDAASVPGRTKALTRAVSNLVDNAIKHGDGEIDVAVSGGTVEVRDHGRGIPEADLPKVFDRFYRADVARTEPGSGLGLAIVAQVVERHGGTVFARNSPDGGAMVGFTLPTE